MMVPMSAFVPDWDLEVSVDDLMDFRAALLQMVKAQERQIDAEKRIIALLEKRLGLRPAKEANPIQAASLAGAVHPIGVTTT